MSAQAKTERKPGASSRVQLREEEGTAGESAQAGLRAQWAQARALLDADLVRRDAAPRTRRAYGVDVEGFARWASENGLDPVEVESKAVRRYVAHLSEQGAAPSTSARKLA